MTEVILSGNAIRLESHGHLARRTEWQPWKRKGFRVIEKDGVTVLHEKEAIRRLALEAFSDTDADLFLFGSRASGAAGMLSDYDLGFRVESCFPPSKLSRLREAFEELPIPSRVDLVNFGAVSEQFKKMVLESGDLEIWKKSSKNSMFT